MSNEYEVQIAKFEYARNEAIEAYFNARPFLVRNKTQEKLIEAGFRLGWETAFKRKQDD